jgi:hypothetical protein
MPIPRCWRDCAERSEERIGWQRGMTVLKDRVRELRPAFMPPDPASRTVYQPEELAQCDLWFPPADIPLGFGQVGRPPVLVMVSGYSRVITARMIASRQGPDLHGVDQAAPSRARDRRYPRAWRGPVTPFCRLAAV